MTTSRPAPPFRPIEWSQRLPDKAVEQIRELINSGALMPGDRLPGERELSARFSVGRTSVREALRVLEALGLIEIRPGAGAFVCNPASATPMSPRWNGLIARRQAEIADWAEIREGLEPHAAALAALRASEEDLQHMRDAIERMELGVEKGDFLLMLEGDLEFHDRVSEATRNQSLNQLNQVLNRALFDTRHVFFGIPGFASESCENHRTILNAIASHNTTAAASAMLNHIQRVKKSIAGLREEPRPRTPVALDDVLLTSALFGSASSPSGPESPSGNDQADR